MNTISFLGIKEVPGVFCLYIVDSFGNLVHTNEQTTEAHADAIEHASDERWNWNPYLAMYERLQAEANAMRKLGLSSFQAPMNH